MTRHPATEGNDLRPERIGTEYLKELGVPIHESEEDIPPQSIAAVDSVTGGFRLFVKGNSDETVELGIEPSVITEGIFPELLG